MSNEIETRNTQIEVLKGNLQDLQGQLADAHKRILELGDDKKIAVEELAKERQLLLELNQEVKKKETETSDLIEKQIEDFPDVMDSKPKTFSQPPQPGYQVIEDSKE